MVSSLLKSLFLNLLAEAPFPLEQSPDTAPRLLTRLLAPLVKASTAHCINDTEPAKADPEESFLV